MPLDLVGAEKVTQLRLGREFKFIEVAKMPVNLQFLEYPGFNEIGFDEIEGFHRYPNTKIWKRIL